MSYQPIISRCSECGAVSTGHHVADLGNGALRPSYKRRAKRMETRLMMILEANHADYESNEFESLRESLTCYVENELSTDEFYGILEDYVPEAGLEAWEGAEAYGIKPAATFKFDGATARVFEASDGCFVAFFSN